MVSKSKEKKVENTDIEIRPKPIQGKGVSHFKMPRWPSGSPQINLFTTTAHGPYTMVRGDSMISAFRIGPALSGYRLCDIDRV